ncbi:MAG TPA: hypothetical protein VGE12_13465 [Noviherbaspirillum sp.]
MKKIVLLAALLLATGPFALAAETEERTIRNMHLGKVTLTVPKDWKAIERHHVRFGTTFYRLAPADKEFEVEIVLNELRRLNMGALVDQDLEKYISHDMARMAYRSVEGAVVPKRFGAYADGVYARLTDRMQAPGEKRYMTQGVRLLGRNAALFRLLSNDADEAVLRQVLEVVSSVRLE